MMTKYRKVLIIGPGLEHSYQEIASLYQGGDCCIVGDGKRDITIGEMEDSLKEKIDSNTMITIHAHGEKVNGRFGVLLQKKEALVPDISFFGAFKEVADGSPLQISMHCCYSGAALKSVGPSLPEGSVVIMYASAENAEMLDAGIDIMKLESEFYECGENGVNPMQRILSIAPKAIYKAGDITVAVATRLDAFYIVLNTNLESIFDGLEQHSITIQKQLVDFRDEWWRVINDRVQEQFVGHWVLPPDQKQYNYLCTELEVPSNFDLDAEKAIEGLFLIASDTGDLSKVKFLLQLGVNVDSKLSNGCTALSLAAESGRKEVVQFLLQSGASPYGSEFCCPQAFALRNEHYDVAKMIYSEIFAIEYPKASQQFLLEADGAPFGSPYLPLVTPMYCE